MFINAISSSVIVNSYLDFKDFRSIKTSQICYLPNIMTMTTLLNMWWMPNSVSKGFRALYGEWNAWDNSNDIPQAILYCKFQVRFFSLHIGLIPDKPSATVKLGRLKTSTYVVVTYRWNRLNQPVVRAKTFWQIWAFIPHIFESCAIYYTSIGLRPYFVWKLCRIILLFS